MSKRLSSFEGIELTNDDENVVTNVLTTNGDPTVVGQVAPIGSLTLSTNGNVYLKINTLDTDWTKVSQIGFNNLTDVTITNPADGETVFYNSITGQWVNTPLQVSNSGRLIQVLFGPIAPISGTVSIPVTTAPPSITSGIQLWSQTITPTNITSTIRIGTSVLAAGSNASKELVIVVFRDNICVGASTESIANKDFPQPVGITIYDNPSTTSPITYSARIGWSSNGGTWYINTIPGFTPGTEFGGALTNNAFTVEEIGTN